MKLDGKVAVITGAGRGMGAAEARLFASEGAQVVVAELNEENGKKVAVEIAEAGGSAIFVRTDVSVEEDVEALMSRASQEFGGIDILVNNAAATSFIAASGYPSLVELSTKDFDVVMKVGVYGPFWACKYAIPSMIERGGGSIINISSLASLVGLPGLPSYAASKGAINALTRQIAFDYSAHNIRCNAIVPGLVVNEFSGASVPNEAAEKAFRAIQFTRLGRNEDIAGMALYMASADSEFMSGHCIPMDGGASARGSLPTLDILAAGAKE